MIKINPLTKRKLKRFRSVRRGYWSLLILIAFILIAIFAECFVNSRALVVSYKNRLFFPAYGDMIPGRVFGLPYDYETNYRDLKILLKENNQGWVLMPLIPYNPYENDLKTGTYPPFKPSFSSGHYLGTDTTGRDIAARLLYGFRISIFFSLILLVVTYITGIITGCLMGFRGGLFDLFVQRIIEIWSNVPFLYIIIIISSIIIPGFWLLIFITAFFSWMGLTWVMRTITYKEKEREYILAAKSMGASDARIIIRHIIPNTLSVIITYIPFSVSGGIVALTSLDYLGFGLPAPTPSWGELLNQGWSNLGAWWIAGSVIFVMVATLIAVTFVGEAVREAFDPKMHTTYE